MTRANDGCDAESDIYSEVYLHLLLLAEYCTTIAAVEYTLSCTLSISFQAAREQHRTSTCASRFFQLLEASHPSHHPAV